MGRKRKTTDDATAAEYRDNSPGPVSAQGLRKISRAERLEMIRIAAYHLAEKRGFEPGEAMDDWLEAERDLEEVPTEGDF